MRLVCPNCDAEYEVEDTAIPRSGRDVQCSACGHAWFQEHPEVKAEAEEEAALFGAAPAVVDAGPALTSPEAAVPEAATPEPAVEEPPKAEPADLPRRSIDESVLAVLREEAEREAAARRGERPAIETQTEMPLPETPRPPARPAPEPAPAPAPAPVTAPRKRELLPAIEEIKSSLTPGLDPSDPAETTAPAASGGTFRSGFVFVVLILVILLALYVMAPAIIAQVPALEPVLTTYVATVNGLRVMLDQQVQGLIGTLQGLMGGSAG